MAIHHLDPEDKTRHELINPMLEKAGWVVQHFKSASPYAAKGVAVEYFPMGAGVGEADYVLFVDGEACGIIEAKKEGTTLTGVEPQSSQYAYGFPKDFQYIDLPLPFVYESSGSETHFTNNWDPKPRSREVFHFHTPKTLATWIKEGSKTLRKRLSTPSEIDNPHLWPVQRKAIENLEESLIAARPRALIQMATGSGKTFTAVNICYRLIKHANAKRILFLVDRSNLGAQTLQEFQNFVVPKDGRKFTELYNVQHLQSNAIDDVSRVCIATIQRVYSMLKGEKQLDPVAEEHSGFENDYSLEPAAVEFNSVIPIEMFDVIIIDECHRSIYNLWKQVLDYFDAFLIGLTATPAKSTIAFFNKNLVMEYSHEEAVTDNVNVDFSVYDIRTKITQDGGRIPKGETIQKRDKRTRRKRWEQLDDEVQYASNDLDRSVVAKDQIRTIIRTFKDKVRSEIFPGRKHVPKTLIYAKDDNHAEEIVQIVREEFDEGNDFAVKITYKTEGQKPEDLVRQFRNEFYPRIAVTVDMIATGTDIKPLEIVFFMRAVRSRNYFEQMKGRGVRVMRDDDFMSVTPDAVAKERFVIVDAVGVTEVEELNDTRPLEQNHGVSFKKLLESIRFGKPTKEKLSSLAGRLVRLHNKLTEEQIKEVKELTQGRSLADFAHDFVVAIDEDRAVETIRREQGPEKAYEEYEPTQKEIEDVSSQRMIESIKPFIGNARLMERLPEIKAETEQIIDDVNPDEVVRAGYSPISTEKAKGVIGSFKEFIEKNKDELDALQVFYSNHRPLSWKALKELSEKIKTPPYCLTPGVIWQAYKQVEANRVHGRSANKIPDFVALLKFELKKADELEPFADTIDKRFARWLSEQRAMGVEFTQEQLVWLEKMKDHIAESIELTPDDFSGVPFNQMGGLGKAGKVFGDRFTKILEALTKELVA